MLCTTKIDVHMTRRFYRFYRQYRLCGFCRHFVWESVKSMAVVMP
jgi:hypothetical protein